jgi:chromosome segregation ATPase
VHVEKLQSQLDEWKAQVQKLRAKAESANADAKLAYKRQADELKEKYEQAEAQLEEIRKAQKSASSDVMDGMTSAWSDLSDAFSKAAKRFG